MPLQRPPSTGTASGMEPYSEYVRPAITIPATTARKDMPSTAPSSPAGPAGRPRPVRTLVAMDQRNTPATTRYETPSSAPSAPPGPAGRPQPVVLSVYSDQKTCV